MVMVDQHAMLRFESTALADWSGGAWRGASIDGVNGFSIDTRTLQPGDLFIALRSEKADGHQHLAAALAAGAAALMVDDAGSIDGFDAPCLVVENTRTALQKIARGYRAALKFRHLAAVTGSVGKTTVKELLADMLSAVGSTARSKGNWNNDLGVPLSLLAAAPDATFGVFEVGMNHPGELDPLCDLLEPDLAIVTCVGPVHIENFEDETGIAREKAAVYRGLRGRGTAIVNADDRFAPVLREYLDGSRVIEVSRRHPADYVYRRLDAASGSFELHERASDERVAMTASLPGDYFIVNVALAAAAARAAGASWEHIIAAVKNYQPLSMRWARSRRYGVDIINDAYNANPVSMRAALQAFMEEPCAGRRWLVLGGMLELGAREKEYHREVGAAASALPDVQLLVVGERGAWIADGAIAAGMDGGRVYAAPDHQTAARWLAEAMKPGDALLLKASRSEAMEKVLAGWASIMDERG
jgi:UDP-N-acetylmuramoyl-tripeptide--D-alanyl-D-alanine ligase